MKKIDWLVIVVCLLLGSAGAWMLYYDMAWGPWVFSDSTEYIVSARNLVAGRGLGLISPSGRFMPLSLHPPFYPLVLSIFELAGIDLIWASKWSNIGLFFLTIAGSGLAVYAITRLASLSITMSLLVGVSPSLVSSFDGAMSEPLFIVLSLASLFLLVAHLTGGRRSLLIFSAISAGLACLTRYAGVYLLIAGAVSLLIFENRLPRLRRVLNAALFGLIAALPNLAWLLWMYTQTGGVASRSAGSSQDISTSLSSLLKSLQIVFSIAWVPQLNELSISGGAKAVLLLLGFLIAVLLFGACLYLAYRRRCSEKPVDACNSHSLVLLGTAGIFFTVYMAVLCASYLFSYPQPDIIDRTLAPAQPFLMLLFFGSAFAFLRLAFPYRVLQVFPILLVIITASSYFSATEIRVKHMHQYGGGYTSVDWRTSDIIRASRDIPPDVPLISNDSAAVLFYTNRYPYDLSIPTQVNSDQVPIRYGDGDDPAQQIFRDRKAALILFYSPILRQFTEICGDRDQYCLDEFTRGLSVFAEGWDGAIYFYSP